MDKTQWGLLVSGAGCQMDAPRPASTEFWDLVAALSVSSLYLAKNQTYRGQCSLIFDLRHAARPDQLSADEWAAFCADLYLAQRAVVSVTRPDHVNRCRRWLTHGWRSTITKRSSSSSRQPPGKRAMTCGLC